MRRALEITVFLGLSAAVHAGVMAGLGEAIGGPEGQGAGGPDRISLQAAPESLSALARLWTTPPDPMTATAALQPTVTSQAPPDLSADSAPRALPQPSLPDQALPDRPPVASDTAAAPPRPAMPVLPPALAGPDVPLAPTLPEAVDNALSRSAPQRLQPPAVQAGPRPDSAAPPPLSGISALAIATSPRPPVRPPEAEAPQPSPPSAPQAARVAAGAGGGAMQGAAPTQTEVQATLSAAARQSLMAEWGAQIMARVERARPRVRASGQVVLALQVSRSGQLAGLSVARSSGDPALDEAALTAVRRAGSFPAAPTGLTEASYAFSLPIRFR